MDKKIYLSIMAALATVAAVWFLVLLLMPFINPLAWALVIGIATIPHYDKLSAKFPNQPNRNAGIMVLAITLSIILPFAVVIVMITQSAAGWYNEIEQLISTFNKTLPDTLSKFSVGGKIIAFANKFGIDLTGYLVKFASSVSQFLLGSITNIAKDLAELLFTLIVTLFVLFFVYRDGNRVVSAGVTRFASGRTRAFAFLSEIRSTTTAVMMGTILTCIAQGALAGLGYFVAGVPAAVLYGALTALMALVPVVGTAIVWAPIVVFLAINGAYLKAGLLFLWCLIFVGFADNAIRPLAIGAKSNIPILAIVLGAIGGIGSMGLIGLILGPLFFSILTAVWREATKVNGEKDV